MFDDRNSVSVRAVVRDDENTKQRVEDISKPAIETSQTRISGRAVWLRGSTDVVAVSTRLCCSEFERTKAQPLRGLGNASLEFVLEQRPSCENRERLPLSWINQTYNTHLSAYGLETWPCRC